MSELASVTIEVLEALGAKWPRDGHPETREPFIEAFVKVETNHQRLERMPAPFPDGHTFAEPEPDEDGFVWEDDDAYPPTRPMTPAEYAEAIHRWLVAEKQGNVFYYKAGPDIVVGRFVCLSGSWARGIYDEGQYVWKWQQWAIEENRR